MEKQSMFLNNTFLKQTELFHQVYIIKITISRSPATPSTHWENPLPLQDNLPLPQGSTDRRGRGRGGRHLLNRPTGLRRYSRFVYWGAHSQASHFVHKMMDVKDLFSVCSPDPRNAVIHGPGLTHFCDLAPPLSWEMKDVQIHEPAWPWRLSWLIFVARGLESLANGFGRKSNFGIFSSLPNFRQIKLFSYFPDIKFEFELRRKEQQQQQGGFLDFLIPSFLKGSPKKRPPPPPPQAR